MSLHVLIVDDEESIRESMTIYLREKGYRVRTAGNPTRCDGVRHRLCRSDAACADVLIIDQWMPVMNGIDFLRQRAKWGCRSEGQHVALMTANLTDELRTEAIGLGCVVFAKPVRLEAIESWLQGLSPVFPRGPNM